MNCVHCVEMPLCIDHGRLCLVSQSGLSGDSGKVRFFLRVKGMGRNTWTHRSAWLGFLSPLWAKHNGNCKPQHGNCVWGEEGVS